MPTFLPLHRWLGLALGATLALGCGEEQVSAGNREPKLDLPTSLAANEGETLAVTAVPDDPDGDAVQLAAAPLPPGAAFDPGTGLFTWTVPFDAARPEPYTVTFTGDDGRHATQRSLVIMVADVNRAPSLFAPAAQSGSEGALVSFTVTATDADTEDTVTVVAPNLPAGAAFDGAHFTWTPSFTQAGPHSVDFVASDEHALSAPLSASRTVVLTIADVNRRPAITSAPVTRIFYEGETAAFTVRAEDSDQGQSVSVSLEDLNAPQTGASVSPGGAFSWLIPAGTRGTFQFRLTARDDGTPSLFDERVESLLVRLTNLPPLVDEIAPRTVDEGQRLTFTATGVAADPAEPGSALEAEQVLRWSMRSVGTLDLPAEAALDPASGAFSWSAGCRATGDYLVEIRATDDGAPARSAARRVPITVRPANCAPAFTRFARAEDGSTAAAAPGATVVFAVDEDAPLRVTASAADEDLDSITYGFQGALPPGASFNALTRALSWRPSCSAARQSPYTAVLTASDGAAAASQVIQIAVRDVNCAPRVTSLCGTPLTPGDTAVIACPGAEGALYSFSAEAEDADSDLLTWTAALPSIMGSAFNPLTRAFSWRPDCQDAGDWTGAFTVRDPGGATASRTVSFAVAPGNCRPEFKSLTLSAGGDLTLISVADADTEKEITLGETAPAAILIRAESPKGLPISYTAAGLPAGASLAGDAVAGTATLRWTPGCADAGDHRVTLLATDSARNGDQLSLLLHVTQSNCPPSLLVAPAGPLSVDEGAAAAVTVSTADPDGDSVTLVAAQKSEVCAGATRSFAALDSSRATLAGGAFAFAPRYTDAGPWCFRFSGSDGSTASTATLDVAVADVDAAPSVTALPATLSVFEGDAIETVEVEATGLDPDPLDIRGRWRRGACSAAGSDNTDLGALPGLVDFQHAGDVSAALASLDWIPDYTAADLGLDYCLTFVAFDVGGTRTASAQVAVTVAPTARPPAAPQNLTATGGVGTVTLNWSPASGATAYEVLRATVSGGPYTQVGASTIASFADADTALLNATPYFYVVRAVNDAGAGPISSQASATTLLPAPRGLTAAATAPATIRLAWLQVQGATGYQVRRSISAGTGHATVATATGDSYTDSGLASATAYYFVVRATNGALTSADSNEASAATAVATPVITRVDQASSQQLNVNWTAVAGATGYTISRSPTPGGPYTEVATVGTSTTTYGNSGLTPGTTYCYVMTASVGGNASALSNEVCQTTPINTPVSLVCNGLTGSITLDWLDTPGATGYRVQRSPTSGGPYADAGTSTISFFTHTPLANGTRYSYVVRATTAQQVSSASNETTCTSVMPVPGTLVATGGARQVALSWGAVADVTGYSVQRSLTSGSGYTSIAFVTSQSYTDTAVGDGVTYYYVVTAVGTSATSLPTNQASAVTAPPAPSNLTAVGWPTGIQLTWNPAPGATSYKVFQSTTSGAGYTQIVASQTPAYKHVGGLASGTTLYFVVQAVNGSGTSANSNEATATTGGAPWRAINGGLGGAGIYGLAADSFGGVLAATVGGGVFRTNDGAASWSLARAGLRDGYIRSIARHPTLAGVAFAGTQIGLYKTTNNGDNWSAVSSLPNNAFQIIWSMAFDPTNGTLYAGTNNSVQKSTDNGASWSDTFLGAQPMALAVDTLSHDVFAGTWCGGTKVFSYITQTWSATAGQPGTQTCIMSMAEADTTPRTIWAGTSGGGLYKTTDGGASWNSSNFSTNGTSAIAVVPGAPSTVYHAIRGTGVYKTTTSGASWSPVNVGLPGTLQTSALAAESQNVLYLGTDSSGVYKTINAGAAWLPASAGMVALQITRLALDPGDPATIFASTVDRGVLASTNRGGSWTASTSGLPATYLTGITANRNASGAVRVYVAAGSSGVYKSTDG